MKILSEQAMIEYGRQIGERIKARRGSVASGRGDSLAGADDGLGTHGDRNGATGEAVVVELTGDVGAGKTTFTKGLAAGLGVQEAVSSPSFTISKRYALPDGGELIHYDFYRLPDPGLMAEDFAEAVSDRNVVVVEWGDSIADMLPAEHLRVEIRQDLEGREVELATPKNW